MTRIQIRRPRALVATQLMEVAGPVLECSGPAGVSGRCNMHADKLWNVLRQDDNGNRFVVETRLSRVAAEQRVAEFESHGHKQVYWLEPADPVPVGCQPDAEPRR